MNAFITFIKQTRNELTHVTWLNRNSVVLFTIAVMVLSLLIAYMLGGFDIILKIGLTKLLAQ